MSANSKIEWCDHTSKARKASVCVRHPVTILTKRLAVAHVETTLRTISKRMNMMRFKIAAAIVTAVHAREFIAAHYIESPLSALRRRSKVFSFFRFSVDIAMTLRAARRLFSGPYANQCAGLCRMLNAGSIATAGFRRRTHLGATLGGHR